MFSKAIVVEYAKKGATRPKGFATLVIKIALSVKVVHQSAPNVTQTDISNKTNAKNAKMANSSLMEFARAVMLIATSVRALQITVQLVNLKPISIQTPTSVTPVEIFPKPQCLDN